MTVEAKREKECRRLVDEWSALVIWRVDSVMKGDWTDNCKGELTPPNDGSSTPWWDVDTTHLLTITIDLVSTTRPISKVPLPSSLSSADNASLEISVLVNARQC
jgi:hypothetical protein